MGAQAGKAPERSDGAPSQRVKERRWLAVAAVTVLILVVAGGARTIADTSAGDSGPPVLVGTVARIQPRPGWELQGGSTDPPAARLHRGPVLLDVLVYPPDALGPIPVSQRYVSEALRPGLASVTVGEAAGTTTAGGVAAVRFGYVGITHDGVVIEGVVTVAADTSASVVFDAYAPQGALATVADDLAAMIDGAEVG
jgi:hypothetical protein